ncbi:hypothetical protein EV702DRAFT_1268624 [Suillus placidus]|uniref:Uncharacterized protein n=1 Tax=Suillus placidus TaxID=48579 RepID=A0A9P6ZV89_9AGAM|nr:hypothetical protein EV702DRAFT_1268624 [Suillus placidus]
MPNTGFPSSPRMPGAATGGESLQLAAPEAFSRPPNAAQPYTPFSVMGIVSKQAGQHAQLQRKQLGACTFSVVRGNDQVQGRMYILATGYPRNRCGRDDWCMRCAAQILATA